MKDLKTIEELRTVLVAGLKATGYRFDKSWRWAEKGPKARFYEVLCTFLLNLDADEAKGDKA